MNAITGGHHYNGDGKDDLIAREASTGYLYIHPGKGNGTFGSRLKIGSSWNSMSEVTAVGDLNHDGHADVLAMRTSNGCLYFYGGNGNGTLKSGVEMACGRAVLTRSPGSATSIATGTRTGSPAASPTGPCSYTPATESWARAPAFRSAPAGAR